MEMMADLKANYQPPKATPAQMAEWTGLSIHVVRKSLARMEAKGLIQIEPDGEMLRSEESREPYRKLKDALAISINPVEVHRFGFFPAVVLAAQSQLPPEADSTAIARRAGMTCEQVEEALQELKQFTNS